MPNVEIMFSAEENFSAAPLIAAYNKILLDDQIVEHLASPGVTTVYEEFNAMQGSRELKLLLYQNGAQIAKHAGG